jgi:hypothetical protein
MAVMVETRATPSAPPTAARPTAPAAAATPAVQATPGTAATPGAWAAPAVDTDPNPDGTSGGGGARRAAVVSSPEAPPKLGSAPTTTRPEVPPGRAPDRAGDSRRPADHATVKPAPAGDLRQFDAAAAMGRRLDDRPAAGGAGTEDPVISAPAGTVEDADRLLGRVVERLRTVVGSTDPALEAHLHDPVLGSVRLLVAGRAGELVRAELVVADPRSADALSRALDRSSTGHGLTGIDLRIRLESRPDAGLAGSDSTLDRGGLPGGPDRWAGSAGGGGYGREADRGRDEAARDRPPAHAVPPVPPLPTLMRRDPTGGSLDVRA